MAIHNAIAASGHDTEKILGNLEPYKDLPGCCQYDHEIKMNQSDKSKMMTVYNINVIKPIKSNYFYRFLF